MRIAYITETFPPEVNGVSLTVARTVRRLRERGHQVHLVRPRQPGEGPRDDAREWRCAGAPLPMYRDLRFGLARSASLQKRWADEPPQLVHLATPGPLAWAAWHAARRLGLRITADFRTNFHQYSRYYGLGLLAPVVLAGLRRLHNSTELTFVPTQAMQRELTQAGFERLAVVGRGVDTERFHPGRRSAALRSQWGADEAAPVLLYVGRLAAEKNVSLALRAFESLRTTDPSARMVVVGDGPQRKALEAGHPAACFMGLQRGDALAACYASADVFLFPSLSDTFGNVTLEALASGLAVVSYGVAAAAEHIDDRVSGLLVPAGDEAGFLRTVAALARQPALIDALRTGAVAAARRARWDEVLSRFESRLQDVADAVATPANALVARA